MEVSQGNREDPRSQRLSQGHALLEAGDANGAAKVFSGLLDEDFNDPKVVYLLGVCLMRQEKFGAAYNLFMRSIAISPLKSEPWNNAAMCHQETWNLDDAEKCLKRALQLDPRNQAAMNNMALVYINRCQPEEAVKWLAKSETVGELNIEGMDNLAIALLMKRDWSGWGIYRQTAGFQKQRGLKKYANPEEPDWNGEPGRVVLYATQGIGDEIAFASCIPDAMEKAEVVLDCDPRLYGLFKRSFPKATVYGTRFKEELPNLGRVDYSLQFDGLPSLFRTRAEDIPGTPYLIPDPERRIQWRALLEGRKPAIGIAWNGGLVTTRSRQRSIALADLAPVLKSVDATWVSLEYKDRTEEIESFHRDHGIRIHHWERATETLDYDDTAGLVAELDLVISVCTAVVHLSGAIGKECWCLTPSKPRWWYGLEGDLPWYKSVKMFRQKQQWPLDDIVRLLKLRFG